MFPFSTLQPTKAQELAQAIIQTQTTTQELAQALTTMSIQIQSKNMANHLSKSVIEAHTATQYLLEPLADSMMQTDNHLPQVSTMELTDNVEDLT